MAGRDFSPFAELFETPLRSGLTKPKAVRGEGMKMVNMGEVFAHRRIHNLDMDRVPMDSRERDSSLLREGDLLFARQSLVLSGAGKCVLFQGDKEDVTFESHIIRCRLDQRKAEPAFYFYLFQSSQGRSLIESIVEQVAAAGIRGSDLGRLAVPVPPLAEQKAIAMVLGALDDKIELNRRMNAALEAMARALFQSWFVDFDPVRAKLDGRQPKNLDTVTVALFPEHFDHGEDGLIPVGWRQAAFEDLCEINSWTLSKSDNLKTLEYVEISEVSRGNIADIVTYSRGEEPSRARRRLRHGDTVLSTVRPDRSSYFLALNPPANRVASTGFAVLTPTKVPWSFTHAALTQPEVSGHLGQMADGGAYPAVRPEVIGAIQVALPNEPKILDAFHRFCAPLFEQAEANRNQSRTLAALRDTLLPKLLSGELSLRPDHV